MSTLLTSCNKPFPVKVDFQILKPNIIKTFLTEIKVFSGYSVTGLRKTKQNVILIIMSSIPKIFRRNLWSMEVGFNINLDVHFFGFHPTI